MQLPISLGAGEDFLPTKEMIIHNANSKLLNIVTKLNSIKHLNENSPHHQHCQTLLIGDGGLRIAPVRDNQLLVKKL